MQLISEQRRAEILAKHAQKYGKKPSRGLGDTIAKVTSAIGIKPCKGCKKRQDALNKLVPYNNEESPDANP